MLEISTVGRDNALGEGLVRKDRGAGETTLANLEIAVAGHSGAKDAGSVAQAESVPRERSAGKNNFKH